MAYRQYIGARYVPLYDGTWDATKNYEPLTIVDDANGNSYTSKKDVPAGTPLSDRNFWIMTSSFSGSVERLQRQVNDIENDVTAINGRITSTEDNVSNLTKQVESGAILCVSDSYGNSRNGDNKTAPALLSERIGLPVYNCFVGGAGFHTGTLLAGLQTFTLPDDSVIKTVIIFCGANDAIGPNVENLTINGIKDMVTYIKGRFTSVRKIILCGVGMCMSSMNGAAKNRIATTRAYVKGAQRAGITYLKNSETALHNTALMQADMVHPNAEGVEVLADVLVSAYYGDTYAVHQVLSDVLLTKHADAPDWFNLNAGYIDMANDDGVVTIRAKNFYYGILSFNTGAAAATISQTTPYTLATMSDTMIDGMTDEPLTSFSVNGLFMINGGIAIPGAARCVITDKKLVAYFTRDSAVGYDIENVVGFVSTDNVITLPLSEY